MKSEQRETIELENNEEAQELFGRNDANLSKLEDAFAVNILARGNRIELDGASREVQAVREILEGMQVMLKGTGRILGSDVDYLIRECLKGEQTQTDALHEVIYKTPTNKRIRARTRGQHRYVRAVKTHDIVFGLGPAGTGKTFLAVVLAIRELKEKKRERIILVRPAVEAGESLGFLPGDLKEKIDPYLRPLYDALHSILGADTASRLIERSVIEIAPLAYMRGRTLDDAFIILDEAQNTTQEQMKMFLTRIGMNSKAVVTGDLTQIDLGRGHQSGLLQCQRILDGIEGIAFHELTETDVVRHPLVRRIIRAYADEAHRERNEE